MKDETIPVILVVDDTPANLRLLFDLLDKAGFEMLVAKNGEQAINSAEKAQPDIILLDVMMPGIDGFETCQRLKTNAVTQQIPVIFMTALTRTADKVKGFELGAVDYITKPIHPEEVLVRIKTHLTIQRLQRDLQGKNQELQVALEREKELHQLKSRFLSMASHESRTPLTKILLSCGVLKRYAAKMPEEKRLEECQVIERAVQRITDLLNDVVIMAKGDSGQVPFQPEYTNIKHLCQDIVETFTLLSERTHAINFSYTGDSASVKVDPKLLQYVLSNLVSNAIKYSPTGGTVTFEAEHPDQDLIFRISDHGIGIPEADQPYIFETFRRGTNVGAIQGSGLGLSIVRQFVEVHGGAIRVESAEHQGTTFTVTLPITP